MRRLAILLLPIALAACQTGSQIAQVQPAAPAGVEGRWASTAGPVAYNATFRNGQFQSVESKTSALLASGTYSQIAPGQITITYTSETTRQRVAANCNQVQPARLSCSSSNGSTFDLVRA
ncbi:hypothetical protein [Aurantimonas sp. Leaf443]|uniref:hypothetical protein n=1 Tax=Aurantimonas sp. Leaf443 TaxID=1736378 RepID=UPI0006FC685F|nr:hypothetical protein [Aurantimonas sp. Leaf443]KQT85814.1 hypothetical protein ASG48_04125 [Aurantimonas sp. Leaf443]